MGFEGPQEFGVTSEKVHAVLEFRWHSAEAHLADVAAAIDVATPGSYREVEVPGFGGAEIL
jgi:hypothetical protein